MSLGISCNPAAADLYECDRTDVLGQSLRFILPDSNDAELTTLRDELISGARPAAHLETRMTSNSGEPLNLYVTISPIRDRRSDEVIGFSAISRPSPVPRHTGDLLDDARLAQLRTTELLDSPPEERYDRFTQLAARLLQAPVALLTLLDDQRQYAKSSTEQNGPLAAGGNRPLLESICAHVVAAGSAVAVSDTRLDPRVSGMPAVIEGNVVAYASSPITTRAGHTLGALCVLDHQPRRWNPEDQETLHALAAIAADEIDQLLENIASRELADARELVADTRDGIADSRDDTADARDRTADRRDVATDKRMAMAQAQSELAAHDSDERHRAFQHQQLVRHRIANPLQIIKGTADTLLNHFDGDLDVADSREMLSLIIEQADLAGRVSLFAPELENDVERELRPKPFE